MQTAIWQLRPLDVMGFLLPPIRTIGTWWGRISPIWSYLFFPGGSNLNLINFTDIVFIPKTHNQNTPTDFRPIGLCNAIYKIISKVLSNRLSTLLPHIIDCCQGAFMRIEGDPHNFSRLGTHLSDY